jgi:hypothetical protein
VFNSRFLSVVVVFVIFPFFVHMGSGLEALGGRWRFTHKLTFQDDRGRVTRCGGEVYPSLLMAGERLFASGSQGVTLVLKPDPRHGFTIAAENRLDRFGGNGLVFSGQADLRPPGPHALWPG